MSLVQFPPDFHWGAASSAFQIEGSTEEGGRSPSIWDRFCAKPGLIEGGAHGKFACGHYASSTGDLDLMQRIGLKNYRFSTAWTRVLPNGTGSLNEPGIDFYDRLVDELLERKIEPWIVLNHWDLPLSLDDRGGWLNRDIIHHFADYALKVASRLGDRIRFWTTHHDPQAMAWRGYRDGSHAPGITDLRSGWIAAHHLLLSHALAAQALHAEAPGLETGINLQLTPAYPASESEADHDAALEFDGVHNRWFLDPLYKGCYPDAILPKAKRECGLRDLDFMHDEDLGIIHQSTDFLGVGYESRALLRAGEKAHRQSERSEFRQTRDLTDTGHELAPAPLKELLVRLHEVYAPKAIYISDNGAAYGDAPNEEGRIPDHRRMSFHSRHLQSVAAALLQGVPVKGYFVKSFLDSFEWTYGYGKRYGLVWVDFDTQDRVLKDSAYWYARVMETGSPSWDSSIDYRD